MTIYSEIYRNWAIYIKEFEDLKGHFYEYIVKNGSHGSIYDNKYEFHKSARDALNAAHLWIDKELG